MPLCDKGGAAPALVSANHPLHTKCRLSRCKPPCALPTNFPAPYTDSHVQWLRVRRCALAGQCVPVSSSSFASSSTLPERARGYNGYLGFICYWGARQGLYIECCIFASADHQRHTPTTTTTSSSSSFSPCYLD